MTESVIAARHLCKSFGSKRVLDDVTESAGQGDVVGVPGRNGTGKTTLLEILLGLSPPTSGEAIAFDAPGMELSETNKKRVGYVPQRDEMIEIVTGKQQIQIGSRTRCQQALNSEGRSAGVGGRTRRLCR